jgi:hypothetical protein
MKTIRGLISAAIGVLAVVILAGAPVAQADIVTDANAKAADMVSRIPAPPITVRMMAIVQPRPGLDAVHRHADASRVSVRSLHRVGVPWRGAHGRDRLRADADAHLRQPERRWRRPHLDQRRRLHEGGGERAHVRRGALPLLDRCGFRDGPAGRRAGGEERAESDALTATVAARATRPRYGLTPAPVPSIYSVRLVNVEPSAGLQSGQPRIPSSSW